MIGVAAPREASFPSPEEAALAGWPRAADPRVVFVSVVGRRAEVHLAVNDDYDYWVHCVKGEDGWGVVVDGNGPVAEWDNPSVVDWATDDT
jgi:hypothetical protein